MTAKRVWAALIAVVAVAVGALALAGLAWRELHSPLALEPDGDRLRIAAGTPFHRVTNELADRGVLDRPWLLNVYARATDRATRVRAGEYELTAGMTPVTLLDKLVAGDVFLHEITIVEGSRFAEVLTALRSHAAVEVTDLDGAGIMAAVGAPGVHPEGQFFPDTYRFALGTKDVEILRVAHQELTARLQAAWANRSADSLLDNDYQALILASIIEKETALATERRLIAGVFTERLRRNMRLQTDPTVIYGLGDAFDGNLRREDLDRDTPYNTYTRGGLPPTPIALPGAASLEAAVTPELSGAIYFVATGRPDGSHYFSTTFEQHQQAVRNYLRELRSREP
jgi:UPF0755 protein